MNNRRRWAQTTWPVGIALIVAIGVLDFLASALLARGRLNQGYLQLNELHGRRRRHRRRRRGAYSEPGGTDGALRRPARRGLALLYMAQARPEAALAAWQQVDGSVDEALLRAERAKRGDDFATAERWYGVAVHLEPDNGDHWYKLARAAATLGDDAAHDYYLRPGGGRTDWKSAAAIY